MGRDKDWLSRAALLAAVAIACAITISRWTGYPATPEGNVSLKVALAVVLLTAVIRFLLHLWRMWSSGCEHPLARMRKELPDAAMGFLPIVLGILIIGSFLSSLSYLKSMIPAVVPFWADAPLARSDEFLYLDAEVIALSLGFSCPR